MLAPRRSTLTSPVRRLIAVLLAVCAVLTLIEPAIADSCDSDAVLAAASLSETGLTVATSVAAYSANGAIPGDQPPVHSYHVCHCVHAHCAVPALPARLDSWSPDLCQVSLRSDSIPPSAEQDRQLRPPRKLNAT